VSWSAILCEVCPGPWWSAATSHLLRRYASTVWKEETGSLSTWPGGTRPGVCINTQPKGEYTGLMSLFLRYVKKPTHPTFTVLNHTTKNGHLKCLSAALQVYKSTPSIPVLDDV
jgi:hypothetical protein